MIPSISAAPLPLEHRPPMIRALRSLHSVPKKSLPDLLAAAKRPSSDCIHPIERKIHHTADQIFREPEAQDEPPILEIISTHEFIRKARLELREDFLDEATKQEISVQLSHEIAQKVFNYIHERKEPKQDVLARAQLLCADLLELKQRQSHLEVHLETIRSALICDIKTLQCMIKGLKKSNPSIKSLLKNLADYHSVRQEKYSFGLQEQYLMLILRDCVLVACCLDPKKSKEERHLLKCLKELYETSKLKKKFLETLKKNLDDSNCDNGLVGQARLERIDPKRRGWSIRSTIWQKICAEITAENREAAKKMRRFFLEVESRSRQGILDANPNLKTCCVRYLTPEERAKYEVTILPQESGRPCILMREGRPYDTQGSWATMQGEGTDIFAFKDKQLFAGRHEIGHFHHSSFFSGGRVDCEGEIKCVNGQLVSINLQSGHYKPTRSHARELLHWLYEMGVDLTILPIETIEPVRLPIHVYESRGSDKWIKKSFEYKINQLVTYKANALYEELNITNYPAPRTSKIDTDALRLELLKYYSRKGSGSPFHLQLPIEMTFSTETCRWEFAFEPDPILNIRQPEDLPLSSPASSSSSASYIDDEI